MRADYGLGAERLSTGARLWLRMEGREAAEDLARRESACCGFLDLELTGFADRIRLDITSLAEGAQAVIGRLVDTEAVGESRCC